MKEFDKNAILLPKTKKRTSLLPVGEHVVEPIAGEGLVACSIAGLCLGSTSTPSLTLAPPAAVASSSGTPRACSGSEAVSPRLAGLGDDLEHPSPAAADCVPLASVPRTFPDLSVATDALHGAPDELQDAPRTPAPLATPVAANVNAHACFPGTTPTPSAASRTLPACTPATFQFVPRAPHALPSEHTDPPTPASLDRRPYETPSQAKAGSSAQAKARLSAEAKGRPDFTTGRLPSDEASGDLPQRPQSPHAPLAPESPGPEEFLLRAHCRGRELTGLAREVFPAGSPPRDRERACAGLECVPDPLPTSSRRRRLSCGSSARLLPSSDAPASRPRPCFAEPTLADEHTAEPGTRELCQFAPDEPAASPLATPPATCSLPEQSPRAFDKSAAPKSDECVAAALLSLPEAAASAVETMRGGRGPQSPSPARSSAGLCGVGEQLALVVVGETQACEEATKTRSLLAGSAGAEATATIAKASRGRKRGARVLTASAPAETVTLAVTCGVEGETREADASAEAMACLPPPAKKCNGRRAQGVRGRAATEAIAQALEGAVETVSRREAPKRGRGRPAAARQARDAKAESDSKNNDDQEGKDRNMPAPEPEQSELSESVTVSVAAAPEEKKAARGPLNGAKVSKAAEPKPEPVR